MVPISSKATGNMCYARCNWAVAWDQALDYPACKVVPSQAEAGSVHASRSCWPVVLPDSRSGFSKNGNKKILRFLVQKSLSGTSHSCAAGNYHHPGEPRKMSFFFFLLLQSLSIWLILSLMHFLAISICEDANGKLDNLSCEKYILYSP